MPRQYRQLPLPEAAQLQRRLEPLVRRPSRVDPAVDNDNDDDLDDDLDDDEPGLLLVLVFRSRSRTCTCLDCVLC